MCIFNFHVLTVLNVVAVLAGWMDFVMDTHYILYETGIEFMILFG
jgi:hypothetical protein